MTQPIEIVATVFFAVAVLHTFSVSAFVRLAHRNSSHAGIWHLLSEVEAIFGVWAFALIVAMAALQGGQAAVHYMNTRNFTELLFVFVIMVVASSRPILELVNMLVCAIVRLLPLRREFATFFVVMSVVPLGRLADHRARGYDAGYPAAARWLFPRMVTRVLNISHWGVLFVNVSIGGVLTSYAAPPVLMVTSTFGWNTAFMATHFGWRAAIAVCLNVAVLTLICRQALLASGQGQGAAAGTAGSCLTCPGP